MRRPEFVRHAITQLENGLHVGRYGRFSVYSAYQPIYQLAGADKLEMTAMEGLVRPYVGDVSVTPNLLFNQVDPEDALFMECLCLALHIRNYRSAAKSNCDLFINVNTANYSSIAMMEREFDHVLKQLSSHGLNTDRIVFELLETTPYSDILLAWFGWYARSNNVRFAMDDFGRGWSNLQRYKSLLPDLVKIDGYLFAKGQKDIEANRQLQETISRIHDDGGKVVIEGIESSSMLALALYLGADYFQGFYLDVPHMLPADFQRHSFSLISTSIH